MKKLFSILFISFYLSSALYASVQMHYCQSMLQSFKVVLQNNAEESCCCGTEAPCCNNENITISTDKHANTFVYKISKLSPTQIQQYLANDKLRVNVNQNFSSYTLVSYDQSRKKRTHQKPLYLLFQTQKMAEPAPFSV